MHTRSQYQIIPQTRHKSKPFKFIQYNYWKITWTAFDVHISTQLRNDRILYWILNNGHSSGFAAGDHCVNAMTPQDEEDCLRCLINYWIAKNMINIAHIFYLS